MKSQILHSLILVLAGLCVAAPERALAQELFVTWESPNAEEAGPGSFGASVSWVPNADGDGRGGYLVGGPLENGGARNAGRAYLFSGTTGALTRTLESPNPEQSGQFGLPVSGTSDTDGDGRGELLIGAFLEDGGHRDAGRVYLFSGTTGEPLYTLESPNSEEGGWFGSSLSGVPDVDGDGRGDLLIGAPREDGGSRDAGRAYLMSGATGEFLRALESPGAEFNGMFGSSVSGLPDTDGDGYGDVLVGALEDGDGGASSVGRAHLFSGATGALLLTLGPPDPDGSGLFGLSTSGVPDADGDGHGDVLVGGFVDGDAGTGSIGRAYLFSGATGALLQTLESPNAQRAGGFGLSVAGVLDADGDGRGDLLVGASRENVGDSENAGRVYLFSGATGALLRTVESPNARLSGANGSRFGSSVSGQFDVDGDGKGDFLVGAVGERVQSSAEDGRAYRFLTGAESTLGASSARASALGAPYPNPSTGVVALDFDLVSRDEVRVRLEVFDLLGRRVAVLADGEYESGGHRAVWDGRAESGRRLPNGVYVVRLKAGVVTASQRVLLLR